MYNKLHNSFNMTTVPRDRSDLPLRAKSVCLAERPRSQYGRSVRSADPNRSRYPDKQFLCHRPQSTDNIKRRKSRPNNVVVKQQNRKIIEKVPCSISVQTLSIPTKYADKSRFSISKPSLNERINNRTKSSNPQQVSHNKRLCQSVGSGSETENKLLVQISEAEQVSDFERILNSNSILWERPQGQVWHARQASHSSASVLPRPRSTYSLHTVSQAYNYLFQQHEDSLQPLIEQYRKTNDQQPNPPSILDNNWYENLNNLSEFYEDDLELKQEIESVTDSVINKEVKSEEVQQKNKNFNVNLASLIGLHINGEALSPRPDLSPEVEKADFEPYEEEWLEPIMSANSDDNTQDKDSVNCLADNLNSVAIDGDAQVPKITFSNCCDGVRSDHANNSDVDIHLAVPTIDSIDESRPPMM